MNAATTVLPEVASFLDHVRLGLADLDEEQREELLDGLEADLSEQLAEGGVLPDPTAYAAELRAAAGLPSGRRSLSHFAPVPLGSVLDRARERWTAWTMLNEATRQAWTFAQALRPAWWVLRAWIAVTLVDQSLGPWEFVSLWPTLGAPVVGPLLLLVAVVVSSLIGLGRLWPGSGQDRSTAARVVLLGLNVLAVVAPLTFTGDGSQQYFYAPAARAVPVRIPSNQPARLQHGRDVVRNIYAYDAAGQPLQGVQLFDQQGRPISVAPQSSMGRGKDRQVTCPWFNGTTTLFNVFPLPQRTQARGTCLRDVDPGKVGPQGFHEPPLASVPPATSPVTQ
ncbi:MAG TPA: hypothetical protein VFI19_17250 [Nocardioides sp.]|nr:hypothetical protein [Nocardioides sp.]